jgi:hypothetical protein
MPIKPLKPIDLKDIVELPAKRVSIVVKASPAIGPVATSQYTKPIDESSAARLSQKPLRRQKPRRLSRD